MELIFKEKDWLTIEGFRFQLDNIYEWSFKDELDGSGQPGGRTTVICKGGTMKIDDAQKKLCDFLDEYFKVKDPLQMKQQRLEALKEEGAYQDGEEPKVKIEKEVHHTIIYARQKIKEIQEKKRIKAEEEKKKQEAIEKEKQAELARLAEIEAIEQKKKDKKERRKQMIKNIFTRGKK